MKIKKICVLNPYIATLGGGEKLMGCFLQFLEERYKDAEIDIIVHNYNEIDIHAENYTTINDLNKKFNLALKHTKLLKVDLDSSPGSLAKVQNKKKIEDITKGYDLFINYMFLSKHIGKAKYNIYLCMFPPVPFQTEQGIPGFIAKRWNNQFRTKYDRFIAISDFTNRWLNKYWSNISEKCTIIYPPVFTEKEMEGRYQETKKQNIIVSVGRFFATEHCKRQLDMVRFFVNHQEAFRNYEYHLVGSVSTLPMDEEYYRKVCELAKTSDNVIIHKDCPYQELMDLYTKAKIFWHATGYQVDEETNPEKMEHFGITTVEAMSFGVVPVVINKGGQRETVAHDENGFLWNTEEECVEHTLSLVNDDNLRRKFALASTERAKLFSTDEFYRQNRRLFDECGL